MPSHYRYFTAVFLVLFASFTIAKDKKSTLPSYVLDAHTVAVVISPDAVEPVTNPNANRQAQTDVEQALMSWGRLHPTLDVQNADLVIVIRKAVGGVSPTVRGGGLENRSVILQPTDGDIRIGGQRGTPPGFPRDSDRPVMGTSGGSSEDVFEVYRGNDRYPLDGPLLWRFYGKSALNAPKVTAVAAFRKAVEEAVAQQQQKPAKPNKP